MLGKFLGALLGAAAVAVPVQSWAAEPPPIEAYGELPGIEQMAISASGDKLAAVSAIEGRRMLLVLDANMVLLNMHGVDEVKVRNIEWIGDDAVLMSYSDTQTLGPGFTANQFEAQQGLVVPVNKGGRVWQIFADDPGVASAVFGTYGLRNTGSHWTGFFGGVELRQSSAGFVFDHGRPSLYAVDFETGKLRQTAHAASEGFGRGWLVNEHGEIAATFDIRRRDGAWKITNKLGKKIVEGVDREGDAGIVAFGNDGDTLIYAAEDPETGFIDWYEVPLDGQTGPVEILDNVDLGRTFRDRITGRFIGFLPHGATSKPSFFDPAKQDAANKLFAAFGNLQVTLEDWDASFNRMVVRTSGNGDSGSWYLVDIAKLEAKPLGSERKQVPAAAVGPISMIRYNALDGLEMDGILTLPPDRDAKNLPIVMFPHGGPSGYDTVEFDWWAQAFASRGYAVFQPNFRGSTNRDQKFRQAGLGQWGRKMQTDISDGLAELARRGIVDPQRACIMGQSYGGYAALAGVTLQQGLYRCAVAVAGLSDLTKLYSSEYRESGSSNMARRMLERELGPPSELGNVSPRRFASQADAPILLIHGKDDTVVKFEHSEKMAEELKRAGKPYEMVVLEKEDHWLSRSETRKRMLSAAVAFVQKYNPAD